MIVRPMADATSPRVGLHAEVLHVVREDETAVRLGSGDVDVYGTPALVALMESAAVRALHGTLELGRTSVGSRIDVEHLAPSAPGAEVRAVATLTGVDGRTLTFRVEAFEGDRPIGRATHTRVIVARDRFGA